MSVAIPLAQAGESIRDAILEELERLDEDFWGAIADAFFAVQEASPVDTHRFQASHTLSAGSPSGYVEPAGSSHPLRGQDHVDAVRAQFGDGDGEVWHDSNLPYSARLVYDGWSSQAPTPKWPHRIYEAAFDARFGGAA